MKVWAGITLSIALAGCNNFGGIDSGEPLLHRDLSIPTIRSAVLIQREESTSILDDDVWVFKVNEKPDDVMKFYAVEMRRAGWRIDDVLSSSKTQPDCWSRSSRQHSGREIACVRALDGKFELRVAPVTKKS